MRVLPVQVFNPEQENILVEYLTFILASPEGKSEDFSYTFAVACNRRIPSSGVECETTVADWFASFLKSKKLSIRVPLETGITRV